MLSRRNVHVAALMVAGVAAGAFATSMVVGAEDADEPRFELGAEPFVFPTNELGEEYGSGLDATSTENMPDLIRAYCSDGSIGYVRDKDLTGDLPSNPEEAASRTVPYLVVIPCYDEDGLTVIGKFEVITPPTPNAQP